MTAWTSVQLRVDVEAVNPLERAQDGGQKQLCVPLVPAGTYWYTLCVNPLPKKASIMGVVHSRGGREFPQFRNPAEALLGSLTRDPERFSQLAPGVPETSGSCHDAGELLRGDPESVYRRLDGLQGAPVASVDEAAADDALAHGGAPGVAAATQGHRSVDNHGATLAVGPQDGVACEAANDGRVNMP